MINRFTDRCLCRGSRTNSFYRSFFSMKCGFPLAEKGNKRKTFFSHTAGSLSTSVCRVSSYMLVRGSVFVLPSGSQQCVRNILTCSSSKKFVEKMLFVNS